MTSKAHLQDDRQIAKIPQNPRKFSEIPHPECRNTTPACNYITVAINQGLTLNVLMTLLLCRILSHPSTNLLVVLMYTRNTSTLAYNPK